MLPETYDPLLVALSYVVAVAGSYTALSLAARLTDSSGHLRIPWLVGGTLAQATGVWSMHFTGMLALRLPVRIAYDLPLVASSFVIAAVGAFVALLLTQRDEFLRGRLVAGGIFIGAGIVGLHFVDIAAMRMAARTDHDAGWITLSVVIAISFGILSLWLGRHHRRDDPLRPLWDKWAGAAIMGLAIVGQHFSAMAGLDFYTGPDTRRLSEWGLLRARFLPQAVLFATLVILSAALLSAALDRRRASRGVLAARMLAARENERRGIARVLHDDVGQLLTALRMNLQRTVPADANVAVYGDTVALVDEALARVRALSIDLRPSILDDLGLTAAVRWYATRQAERFRYEVAVVENVGGKRVGEAVETAAFRIIQQALTNIARHARARNVRISLRLAPGLLDIAITDDGVGFNVPAARLRAEAGESLGLLDMKELSTLAGATLSITSKPGSGSTVHVRFHLPKL